MAGHTNFRDIQKSRPRSSGHRVRVDQIKQAMDDVIALAALRQQRGLTQVAMAHALGTTQGNVSQIERREDLYLSTLRDYVSALGGELEVVAVFPDGQRVALAPESGAGVTR